MVTATKHHPKVVDFFHATFDNIGYLYSRWLDEREYEDFADYEKYAKQLLPDGFFFIKMTKRPFGMQFSFDGKKYKITVTTRVARLSEVR